MKLNMNSTRYNMQTWTCMALREALPKISYPGGFDRTKSRSFGCGLLDRFLQMMAFETFTAKGEKSNVYLL